MFIKILSCYASKVLLLTDIHFNPYAQCSIKDVVVKLLPGTKLPPCKTLQALIENPIEKWPTILEQKSISSYKQETNNAFLIQGLNSLATIDNINQVTRILIAGDLLQHNFNDFYHILAPQKYNTQEYLTKFSYKTILYVLQEIHKKLPNRKIYMVLGNNDSDLGDYNTPSASFLQALSKYLGNYTTNSKEFTATFNNGGYFATTLSNKIMLIGLNSDPLSALYSINSNQQLAKEQLIWLETELIKATQTQKKVIILQHIPYGIDLYKTVKSGGVAPTPVLDIALQDEYLNLLLKYSSIITAVYAGHYHAEYLSLLNSTIPLIGSIAFNSFNGNNPGFKIIDIDNNGSLVNYTTYSAPNGDTRWTELYNFTQIYTNSNIVKTLEYFPVDVAQSKVKNYRKNFNGNNQRYPQPISSDPNWKYYYCGIKNVKLKDYTNCINLIEPAL